MLVLSRHRDESIIIRDDIIVTVIDIRGDKVRLGINAPVNIPVHRQEVYEQICREATQKFQTSLQNERYQEAYDVILNGYYRPNRDEASKLITGLTQSGKLDEKIKSKLEECLK